MRRRLSLAMDAFKGFGRMFTGLYGARRWWYIAIPVVLYTISRTRKSEQRRVSEQRCQ